MPNLLLVDGTLRGAYNCVNSKGEIAAARCLGHISYSLHVPVDVQTCGCADLYMGENALSAYMEAGGRVCT